LGGGYSLLIVATIMILAFGFVRGGFMEIIQVISPHLRDQYLMLIGKHNARPGNVPPGQTGIEDADLIFMDVVSLRQSNLH
jgi:hypothetical protein